MSIQVSVLICTHQPDPIRFKRVLQGLSQQTLDRELWELIVIDNASATPVQLGDFAGRVVVEPALGIASARARALRELTSPLAVFVDDDNVLAPDYLEQCLEISRNHPNLGCWGCSSEGEYECEPPAEMVPFLYQLAVQRAERVSWSNRARFPILDPLPFGAGLCFRRELGQHYLQVLDRQPERLQLGRAGAKFTCSCEDTDLVLSSCDIGLGYGIFPQLKLVHLIPAVRLKPAHLLQLFEGSCFGVVLLKHWRGQPTKLRPMHPGLAQLLYWTEWLIGSWLPFRWRVNLAQRRGERKACEYLSVSDR